MTPVNMVDEAAWIECLNTMQGNLNPWMVSMPPSGRKNGSFAGGERA